MRFLIIGSLLLLSGCSTIGQIGEIEGLGEVGETIRAIESSRVVIGGKPAHSNTASVINRTQGEIRQMDDGVKDIPSTIQSVKYIFGSAGRAN